MMTVVGISGGIGRAAHDFPPRRLATYSSAASICCGSYRRVTLLISRKYSADPHLVRVGAPAIARTAFSRAGWTMNRAGIPIARFAGEKSDHHTPALSNRRFWSLLKPAATGPRARTDRAPWCGVGAVFPSSVGCPISLPQEAGRR